VASTTIGSYRLAFSRDFDCVDFVGSNTDHRLYVLLCRIRLAQHLAHCVDKANPKDSSSGPIEDFAAFPYCSPRIPKYSGDMEFTKASRSVLVSSETVEHSRRFCLRRRREGSGLLARYKRCLHWFPGMLDDIQLCSPFYGIELRFEIVTLGNNEQHLGAEGWIRDALDVLVGRSLLCDFGDLGAGGPA